jgi:hypothetical protein
MASYTETPRQQLLKSLRGRSIHIPDLQALLAQWPQDVNTQLEHLKKDVDEKLQRCVLPQLLNLERLSVDSIVVKPFSCR